MGFKNISEHWEKIQELFSFELAQRAFDLIAQDNTVTCSFASNVSVKMLHVLSMANVAVVSVRMDDAKGVLFRETLEHFAIDTRIAKAIAVV